MAQNASQKSTIFFCSHFLIKQIFVRKTIDSTLDCAVFATTRLVKATLTLLKTMFVEPGGHRFQQATVPFSCWFSETLP